MIKKVLGLGLTLLLMNVATDAFARETDQVAGDYAKDQNNKNVECLIGHNHESVIEIAKCRRDNMMIVDGYEINSHMIIEQNADGEIGRAFSNTEARKADDHSKSGGSGDAKLEDRDVILGGGGTITTIKLFSDGREISINIDQTQISTPKEIELD